MLQLVSIFNLPQPTCPVAPHPRNLHPHRQEAYSNWFPEDVTFQPKLVAAQRPAGSLASTANGAAGQAPLVERLYASYEKVGAPNVEGACK